MAGAAVSAPALAKSCGARLPSRALRAENSTTGGELRREDALVRALKSSSWRSSTEPLGGLESFRAAEP